MPATRTLTLRAAKHALDWAARFDTPADSEADVVHQTARTVTLDLTDDALADLVADALYYAEEMGPDNTGDFDYRPAARACLRAIDHAGITWTRRPGTFSITLTA